MTWRQLLTQLSSMSESQALKELTNEYNTRKRPAWLYRLHAHYNQLRYARERKFYGLTKT